jgi:dimethylargininase
VRFSHAIVRTPCSSFADGLTTAGLGAPDVGLARAQHEAYVAALRELGLQVTVLPADDEYPDSTFVEDTAVVTADWALAARPGAPSRAGEVESIRQMLSARFQTVGAIEPPGTLDGGDICEAGDRFFIGLSHRTNEAGAAQLAGWLSARGRPSTVIDVRAIPGLLHLKSGMAALDPKTLVVTGALSSHPALSEYRLFFADPEEAHAANCVRVNDRVLLAAGAPGLERLLRSAGHSPLVLDVSEYRKMDGGLSCLSLRY